MSGHWVKLHDIRVNTEAQNPAIGADFWQPLLIARCLSRLFDVESFLPDCEQGDDCQGQEICECHGFRY